MPNRIHLKGAQLGDLQSFLVLQLQAVVIDVLVFRVGRCARSLFGMRSDGRLDIPLGWLTGSEAAEVARDEFKKLLEAQLGLSFPAGKNFHSFAVDKWYKNAEKLKAVVSSVISEARQLTGDFAAAVREDD